SELAALAGRVISLLLRDTAARAHVRLAARWLAAVDGLLRGTISLSALRAVAELERRLRFGLSASAYAGLRAEEDYVAVANTFLAKLLDQAATAALHSRLADLRGVLDVADDLSGGRDSVINHLKSLCEVHKGRIDPAIVDWIAGEVETDTAGAIVL